MPISQQALDFAQFFVENRDNPAEVYDFALGIPELFRYSVIDASRVQHAVERVEPVHYSNKFFPLYLAAGKAGVTDWSEYQKTRPEFSYVDDATLADAVADVLSDPLKFYQAVSVYPGVDASRVAQVLGMTGRTGGAELGVLFETGWEISEANYAASLPGQRSEYPTAPPRDENQYGMTAEEVAFYENEYATSGYVGGPAWVAMSPDLRAAIMSGRVDVSRLTEAQRSAIPSPLVMFGTPEGMTLEQALDGGILPDGYGQMDTDPIYTVTGTDLSDAEISTWAMGIINGAGTDAQKARAILQGMATYGVTVQRLARATGFTTAQVTAFLSKANTGGGGGSYPPAAESGSSPVLKYALIGLSIWSALKGGIF